MRKLLIALLILALIPVAALAAPQTIDLETMSYDELLALSQSVEQAMEKLPEWKGVTVPPGTYTIGVDIPVGKYTIVPSGTDDISIRVYSTEDVQKNELLDFYWIFPSDGPTNIDFADGTSITLRGSALFKPFTGLGF